MLAMASILLSSCGIQAKIRRADKRYQIGEYYKAAELYRSCYRQLKRDDRQRRAEVAFKQGECYRHINNTKATSAYQNAIRNRYPDSTVFLYYAQTLHYQGKYKDAAKAYNTYLQWKSDDYVALAGKYACEKVAEWKKEFTRYQVKPATEFNNKRYSSFAPMFIGNNADALMFTSNRTTASRKTKKVSDITGAPVNALYSVRKNSVGKWEEVEKAEGLTGSQDSDGGGDSDSGGVDGDSGGGDEGSTLTSKKEMTPDIGVCCFTDDGRTLYFTYSKSINGSDLGAAIYRASRASGTWGEPQLVKIFEDSTITCAHPALSYSGDTLYFVSDAPGGYGGMDLWMVEQEGSNWVNPQNLGPVINTAADEMFPTIRKDGTLYFSSKGHPGYGGLDIYKAVRQDTTFLLYNMGNPFNTNADDFGITFAGDSENGFFSSNRNQKKGLDMIYSFTLPELVFAIEGSVVNQNNEPIDDATVRLVGNDGTNVKARTRKDGTYRLKLKQDTRYVMMASARGYLNEKHELNTFDLKDSKTYDKSFHLSSISKPVTMNNIFYEFAKWELTPSSEEGLNQLISILNDNPNITIELSAHTDRVGNAESNKQLSEKRAQSVVNYLIQHGIDQERLKAVGYGKDKPVIVDKTINDKYPFLPLDQELNEEFIDTLTPDQQNTANQINRRTEFRVLSVSYKLY